MITTRLGTILRIIILSLIQFENIYLHLFAITGIWLITSGDFTFTTLKGHLSGDDFIKGDGEIYVEANYMFLKNHSSHHQGQFSNR